MSYHKWEVRSDGSSAGPVDPLALTLDQALARFAGQYIRERRLGQRTCVEYVADLQDAFAFLRDECRVVHVPVVRQSHLAAYLQRLDQRGISVSTRRRKATSLRVFFRFLSQHGYLLVSPADQLLPPDRAEPPTRFLTEVECQRLVEAAQDQPRDLAILTLFLQTGIRRSELTKLLVSDLQLPTVLLPNTPMLGSLRVRGGTGQKERTIMLTDSACRALHAYLSQRPDVDDHHLFLSRLQRGLGSWGVEDVVKKHLRLAGIAEASPQSLRHTFALRQVKQGTPLAVLQEILGHESLATTAWYAALVHRQLSETSTILTLSD